MKTKSENIWSATSVIAIGSIIFSIFLTLMLDLFGKNFHFLALRVISTAVAVLASGIRFGAEIASGEKYIGSLWSTLVFFVMLIVNVLRFAS